MNRKHNIPKDQGFKVPDVYFTSSKMSILDQVSLEKRLSHRSGGGFEVPENYFKTSKVSTLDTLSRKRTSTPTKGKLITFKPYFSAGLAIAASLLLLVAITYFKNDTVNNTLDYSLAADYLESSEELEDIQFEEWLSMDDIESLEKELSFEETSAIEYLQDRTSIYDHYID